MRGIKTITISILAVGLLADTAVGVAAQGEEASSAVYATGTFAGEPADWVDPPDVVVLPDGNDARGIQLIELPVEFTDPRLSGLLSYTANATMREFPDGTGTIETRTYRITNDDGAWTGTGHGVTAWRAETDLLILEESMVLTGEDGYEGYVAYITHDLAADMDEWQALILEADLPPVPEPVAGA